MPKQNGVSGSLRSARQRKMIMLSTVQRTKPRYRAIHQWRAQCLQQSVVRSQVLRLHIILTCKYSSGSSRPRHLEQPDTAAHTPQLTLLMSIPKMSEPSLSLEIPSWYRVKYNYHYHYITAMLPGSIFFVFSQMSFQICMLTEGSITEWTCVWPLLENEKNRLLFDVYPRSLIRRIQIGSPQRMLIRAVIWPEL